MTKQPNRYRWIVIPVAIVFVVSLAVGVLLNLKTVGNIGCYLLSCSQTLTVNPIPPPDPAFALPMLLDVVIDGPPDENTSIAHKMLQELSDAINGRCHENAGELVVYSHFITSHSYLADGVSFTVPAIAKFPPPPVKKHSDYPYKQSVYDQEYQKDFPAWQQTIVQLQKQVAATCATVKQETHVLATQAIPYDDKGSDVQSALLESSHHLEGVTGMKKLLVLIASLFSTTSQQETGPFTLTGVSVLFMGRTCLTIQGTPANCQQTMDNWSHYLTRNGATKIVDSDPQTSALALQSVF